MKTLRIAAAAAGILIGGAGAASADCTRTICKGSECSTQSKTISSDDYGSAQEAWDRNCRPWGENAFKREKAKGADSGVVKMDCQNSRKWFCSFKKDLK